MTIDHHKAGLHALADVARAATAALRAAVKGLPNNTDVATRAVNEQATLLSKAVGSLAKRMETEALPKGAADAALLPVHIADVTELLDRIHVLKTVGPCPCCGGVQIDPADDLNGV